MKVFNVILILILGVSLTSCYEREEGCLDLLSSEYSLSADDACDDCCVYPALQLLVFHRLGDAIYSFDSILTNTSGQEYKISSAQVFFSDFDLNLTDGEILNVRESALFEGVDGTEEELQDDHVFFSTTSSLVKMGTIRENGAVESLGFEVGIDHELAATESESAIFSVDSLYSDEGYYDINLYLKMGPSLEDNKTVRIFLNKEDSNILLEPIDVVKTERIDFGLQVTINYELLLENIVLEEGLDVQFVRDYSIPNNLITLVQ